MNDDFVNPDCTSDTCLEYLADAGSRWAYHNAPYTLLDEVISGASGSTINQFYNTRVRNRIGMGTSAYIPSGDNNVMFSTARAMARFGLMILNVKPYSSNFNQFIENFKIKFIFYFRIITDGLHEN